MKGTLLQKCCLLVLCSGCSCWAATSTYLDRDLFVSATATIQGTHQEITFDPYAGGHTQGNWLRCSQFPT